MDFEWHPEKDAASRRKHGVSFDEASTVFGDPLALTIGDPDHSSQEARFLTTGLSSQQRLIIVAHADHGASASHHQRAQGDIWGTANV